MVGELAELTTAERRATGFAHIWSYFQRHRREEFDDLLPGISVLNVCEKRKRRKKKTLKVKKKGAAVSVLPFSPLIPLVPADLLVGLVAAHAPSSGEAGVVCGLGC